MTDFPFTFLYEEDDKKIYVACSSADLTILISQMIDFLKAVGYENKDIVEELKAVAYPK